MNQNDPIKKSTESLANKIDSAVGKKIALASNKVMPVVAPILINLIWKHKYKILMILIGTLCLCGFLSFSALYQITIQSRGFMDSIPTEHKDCITKAHDKYSIEIELLVAFGEVISKFDSKHTGSGIGFLEIDQATWNDFGVDENGNKTTDSTILCNNYFTLANKFKSLDGDSKQKIDEYNSPKKEDIQKVYEILRGFSLVPYGNPIGLNDSSLATVTSGYDISRVVNGIINVHTGIDFVPSEKWFQENPGKGTTDAIDKAIVSGKVSEFKDSYGALCVYVSNDSYRTLYCHCNSFIAKDGSEVKYGDPICFLGNTGFSTGAHVHVEVHRKNSSGGWEILDPTPFVITQ